MSEPTFLFDIDGLINYPGFADQVLRPLARDAADIRFFTYDYEDNAEYKLKQQGLDDFVEFDIIGQNFWTGISWAARDITQLGRAPRLEGYMQRHGIDKQYTYDEYAKLILEREQQRNESKFIMKDARLLGKQPFLLIDSDSTSYDGQKKALQRYQGYSQDSRNLAKEHNYSVIIVPEYPNVWEDKTVVIPPEEVIRELQQLTWNWQGEQLIVDLGEKLGIYQEVDGKHPERG